jgi:hypothetical protein
MTTTSKSVLPPATYQDLTNMAVEHHLKLQAEIQAHAAMEIRQITEKKELDMKKQLERHHKAFEAMCDPKKTIRERQDLLNTIYGYAYKLMIRDKNIDV